MGDRVSISFVNSDLPEFQRESAVVLYSHWDGAMLPVLADNYVKELRAEQQASDSRTSGPLDRREPSMVMVDFLRWLLARNSIDGRVNSNYRLQTRRNDEDNGHYVIELADWHVRL